MIEAATPLPIVAAYTAMLQITAISLLIKILN